MRCICERGANIIRRRKISDRSGWTAWRGQHCRAVPTRGDLLGRLQQMITDLTLEARGLKNVVAEQTLKLRLLKKCIHGGGSDRERGIPDQRSRRSSVWLRISICQAVRPWTNSTHPRTTYYRWYDRYRQRVSRACRINRPNQNTSGTHFR